jgi:hypothetical protein
MMSNSHGCNAMNRSFPIDSEGIIFFHNEDTWDRTLIDSQEIPNNHVQLIRFEDKTALVTPKLIQEIMFRETLMKHWRED